MFDFRVDEMEGMNEDLSNQYQYRNMVLEEYEEMLKEIEQNKEILMRVKQKRKVRERLMLERDTVEEEED